jgi:hypothetical protein
MSSTECHAAGQIFKPDRCPGGGKDAEAGEEDKCSTPADVPVDSQEMPTGIIIV